MSYTVNKKNGSFTVDEGTLNQPPQGDTSLQLVGKDYFGYGEAIAQNFVDLLQNFANDTQPDTPIEGQLWWDTNGGANLLKIYSGVEPNGTWLSIDPSATGPTSVRASDNVLHDVWITRVSGVPVAAFYERATFQVHSSDPVYSHFQNINTGITLSSATGMKFHGTATSAQYADLAEMYSSDEDYKPGTVVKIGGTAEVTQTTSEHCEDVFGIVSTDPAYLMNSTLEGTSVAVALEGRVPCLVTGKVSKGQRLVSSNEPGVAMAASNYATYQQIVARALEDKETDEIGLIEVVVGVK